jgi:hypothetical protein
MASLEIITNYITNRSVSQISDSLDEINLDLRKKEETEESDEIEENAKISDQTQDYNLANSEEDKNNSNDELLEKASNLKEEWKRVENKLAYFGEHDELEKIGYAITQLEENIRNEEFDDALLNNIESKFWLNHFKEKDSFTLKNIF